ncbi:MAG: hypothetical protein Fur0021_29010 [Candidatus Promineifilaceae bacterium]
MAELGEPLSERELDVLHAIARGDSTREIALALSISPNTVKVHLRRIYAKLGVSSRTEAMRAALAQGLVALPEIGAGPGRNITAAVKTPVFLPVTEAAVAPSADGGATFTDDGVSSTDDGAPSTDDDASSTDDDASSTDNDASSTDNDVRLGLPRHFPWRWATAAVSLLALLIIAILLLRGTAPAQDQIATPVPTVEIDHSRWFTSQRMPAPTAHMAVASLGLDLYQIGGETNVGVVNTVRLYDTRLGQWRLLSAKPTAVADAAAAVLGGEVYVAGGRLVDGQATAVVEAYSPTNNAWRPVAALPRAAAGGVLLSDGSLLYFVGGGDGTTAAADSFVYDPGSNGWRLLPAMTQARAFASGGIIRGVLYVVGGLADGRALATCEAFDPAAEMWTSCPPMGQARSGAGAAVLVNKLYVFGGVSEPAAAGELYDPQQQTWQSITIPPGVATAAWRYLGVANIESQIYVWGGRQAEQFSAEMVVYAPLENKIYLPAAPGGGE